MEDETKPCQSRNVAQKCAVCTTCCASTFEITNRSKQKTQCDCVRLFFHVGLRFYDERNRKFEKALKVNFEMYQVYRWRENCDASMDRFFSPTPNREVPCDSHP